MFKEVSVTGIFAVVSHHHGDPGGTGMVDAASPEPAHAHAPVIYGVWQHVTIFDPDETFCIAAELFFP